ncbi:MULTISPECIES: recombination-associated protein RdgC [unclassified Neisseria]|uniref:recombination-associated protein RdgC n=1 Tax=unclassified Neisseria TaxID=2623750 RepID=UPI00266507B4|nr:MULTISPECIES: recombination-associated protein RdgC [unclassified Neisseria]MDO1509967.1 recombination-associated protein RdgC [Neisseria sp. MVDL19-042950]MDO1516167.1 recombination-associated protein RdgC [Neisseria sp. MVDL18-041461]MDO1563282.1 recombination-associated protein RdgC [Neisseria sp. MVDL20-010259]
MWFKQLTAYRLPQKPEEWDLDGRLSNAQFTPPAGLDWYSEGFAIPTPFDGMLVYNAGGHYLINLKREEKVLPSGVINNVLAEKVEQIQKAEARNVGRREKQELKEQITDDLLPRALTRSSRTHAILTDGWMLVDSATPSKAENLLTKLREALGGLDVKLPATKQSPSSLMTEWLLNGQAQGGFELDYDVTLRGVGDVAPRVKISKKDLTTDDVVQHARNGLYVVEMGLVWREQIAFVLTENLTLKRIQYLDTVQENAESQADNAADLAVASQIIMTESLTTMLNELVEHLGGWQD